MDRLAEVAVTRGAAPPVTTAPARDPRAIGEILAADGKLAAGRGKALMRLRSTEGRSFSNAAAKRSFASETDVERARAQQPVFPDLPNGDDCQSENVVTSSRTHLPEAEAFKALPAQFEQWWFDSTPAHTKLAIVGPGRGGARTYVSANFAIAFGQLDHRTLLVDADRRNPRQHVLFKLPNKELMTTLREGRGTSTLREIKGLSRLTLVPGDFNTLHAEAYP